MRGGLGGLLGPVFLLAPIALLALRHRAGRQLLLAALVFSVNYFSNISPRFLLPALPFIAMALALVLSAVPGLLLAVTFAHAVISWPALVPKYASPNAWHLSKVPWREALRIKPEGHYLETHLFYWNEMEMVEAHTGPGATVFTYKPIPESYTSRRILVQYESEPNQIAGLLLQTACDTRIQPVWRVCFRFPRQDLRAIRLEQTGSGDEQWNIHELRLYDGSSELPREAAWRITAKPYPWNIQQAFDNSLLTFWRCGQALHPGEFVEMRLPEAKAMDSVLMEAEPNQQNLRLKLTGMFMSGEWTALGTEPDIYEGAPALGLREAAARELKLRGIDYILAWNDEPETVDLRRSPELWHVREVAQTKDARLFQLP